MGAGNTSELVELARRLSPGMSTRHSMKLEYGTSSVACGVATRISPQKKGIVSHPIVISSTDCVGICSWVPAVPPWKTLDSDGEEGESDSVSRQFSQLR